MSEFQTRHGRHPSGVSASEDALRVGLFNVRYSPNLGDGLLSECLEAELVRAAPELTVETFDLAGRTEYAEGGQMRRAALGLLQSSPMAVRHSVVKVLLGRSLRRIRPNWRRKLLDVDVAVTGGGNLFSDSDLNFPLKIDGAWDELRTAGIPIAVFGVGVTDNWSAEGAALIRRAFAGSRIVDASVRDGRSAEIWNRRLGPSGVPRARVVHDPGLLVARHVPKQRANSAQPVVGLGLTHPTTLSYHSDERGADERKLTAWYVQLIEGCLSRGWRVLAFTNGSPEDETYLRKLETAVSSAGAGAKPGSPSVAFEPRFRNPGELASFVSSLDLLMAHRLHANIAAYSYGIPQIGFSWDVKLRSFFESVGRGEYVLTAGDDGPETVLALAEHALREGVDPGLHGATLDKARADVADLARKLKDAVRRPGLPKALASSA